MSAKSMLDEARELYQRAAEMTGRGRPIYIAVTGGMADATVEDFPVPNSRYIIRGGMSLLLNEEPGSGLPR